MVVLYGRDVFYCQLDYWLFYNEGHELYLTPNGVVLSYVDVPAKYLYFMRRPPHEEDVGAKRWNKRQQESREERGSVDPESSSDAAAGRGSMDPAPGAGSSSDPRWIYGSGTWQGEKGSPGQKVDAKVCLRNHHSLNQLTPKTFGSPSTKPRDSSLVEEWRPMRP